MTHTWNTALTKLRHHLKSHGLDLCQLFSIQRYNSLIHDTQYHLAVSTASPYERQRNEFVQTNSTKWHLNNPNPVDTYVQQAMKAALAAANIPQLAVESSHGSASTNKTFGVVDIRYAHEMAPGRLLPIQTVAHAAGLAYYLKSIGLCSHPIYGPWIAFRTVVLFEGSHILASEFDEVNLSCPFSLEQQEALSHLLNKILTRQNHTVPRFSASNGTDSIPSTSMTVDDTINALLDHTATDQQTRDWIHQVCHQGQLTTLHGHSPRLDWLLLRVRAAAMLNIDSAHWYVADQAAYHYSKRLTLLEEIVEERES
ncbi:hypothetical protein BDF19DRAFT_425595 [Syncephalis fuscata]|nr:hypothetical protein BDF19DRAFT_425595 [Syncephalis fuscata]